MIEDDAQTSDELSLGRPPSLDPIGREIARMKIGDALFPKREEPVVVPHRDRKPMWHAVVVGVLVVMSVLAIMLLR